LALPETINLQVATTPPSADLFVSLAIPSVDLLFCPPADSGITGLFVPITLANGTLAYIPVIGNTVNLPLADGSSIFLITDGVTLSATLSDNTAINIPLVSL
jgi:hypothetical protein